MEKSELRNIFENSFNLEDWQRIMRSLFKAEDVRQEPKPIETLPSNELAYDAFELGSTNTSDERLVGFYLVNLKPNVWIEANRVGLRGLLRNVYKYDVDGALIVFVQGEKWRFSFVSEIRELNDEGEVIKTETETKRYTYLMGKGEVCRTATERFNLLNGKLITLNDIKEVFSVEKLNKDFYNELSNWYFWALQNVTFPDDFEKDEEVRNATSVIRLITRLIFVWFLKQKGLIPNELFNENELKKVLNYSDKTGSTYYKAILQNLFFATLNTEMGCEKRKFVNRQYGVQGFYRYERFFSNKERFLELTQNIPFLNGGLFENLDKNIGEENEIRIDCFSNKKTNETRLSVPDFLFFSGTDHADLSRSYGDNNHGSVKIRGLIELLKSYNFTIEENTPLEIEIALDPELLGKVFENLLASYNPETKTTARKQTGSFYTPREIVNYMVDESIIAYLKNQMLREDAGIEVIGNSQVEIFGNETRKGQLSLEHKINGSHWIGKETELDKNLREVLAFGNDNNPFDEKDSVNLIKAINNSKILDPACGSGAFPMGILKKMVLILQKLDKDNKYWLKVQEERAKIESQILIERIEKDKEYAQHISFEDIRKKLVKELDERLADIRESFDPTINEPDYARKLYLVENCIYGVDVQPIAVQIAKLRFFISLIIDQNIDNNKPNRGILTLPNLETKFVAANTLIGINKTGGVIRINEIIDKEKELTEIRHKHFSARTPETKRKYRELDYQLREKIADLIATETKNNVEANKIKLENKKIEFELGKKAIASLKIEKEKKKYKSRLSALEQEITKLRESILSPDSIDQTARQLAEWNPYDQNESASFYDSEWMFGIYDGFDIVIGNPPYIAFQRMAPESKKTIQKRQYKTYANTGDIYALFYEKGTHLLKDNGILTYITSRQWMQASYGKSLRKFLATETNPIQLIDFGQTKIFEGATVFVNVIVLEKAKNKNNLLACLIPTDYDVENENLSTFFEANRQKIKKLNENTWRVSNSQHINEQIEKIGEPLSEWKNIEFYAGIKTGLNEAFHITAAKRDELINIDNNSDNAIKPLLRGKDIKRYSYEYANLYTLFIPWHFPLHDDKSISKSSEKAEIEFRNSYPVVYNYLSQFKDKLSNRNKAETGIRYEWYALQRYGAEFWENYEKPKIVWIEISDRANYAYDDQGMYLTNSAYFLTCKNNDTSLKYLLAVLNSKVADFYFSQITARIAGGRMRYTKQFVEQIPIPKIQSEQQAPFVKLVDIILFLRKQHFRDSIDKNMHFFFEEIVDLAVVELYFEEQIKKLNLEVIKHLQPIVEPSFTISVESIRKVYKEFNNPDHPIHEAILMLKKYEPLKTIEETLNRSSNGPN